MPFPRIYKLTQTPSPSTPGREIVTKTFEFDDASPKKVFTLVAGFRVLTAQIIINEIFDDPAATLELGDGVTVDKYISANDNIPNELGEYEANPYVVLTANLDFYLTIVKGASTQGKGVVVVVYDQPLP